MAGSEITLRDQKLLEIPIVRVIDHPQGHFGLSDDRRKMSVLIDLFPIFKYASMKTRKCILLVKSRLTVIFLFSHRQGSAVKDRDGYVTPRWLSQGLWWPAAQTAVYPSAHLVLVTLLRESGFRIYKASITCFN